MAGPYPLQMPPQGNPFMPPPNPCYGPLPPGVMQPGCMQMPPFQAKTNYRYCTPTGGPPSDGAPPGGPPPPYPGGPQICFPNGPTPSPIYCQPMPPWSQLPPCSQPLPPWAQSQPQWGQPPPSSMVYAPSGPPPAPPSYVPPPGAQPHPFQHTGQRRPPRPGSRVQGELPMFPNGKPPMINSQDICTFHFVKSNIKPWDQSWAPYTALEFEPYRAPTNLTIKELIDGAGARGEYPADYPWQYIGFTEALGNGNGTWSEGSTFLLGDDWHKLNQTLAQVGWTRDRGEAGQKPPVTLVFAP